MHYKYFYRDKMQVDGILNFLKNVEYVCYSLLINFERGLLKKTIACLIAFLSICTIRY